MATSPTSPLSAEDRAEYDRFHGEPPPPPPTDTVSWPMRYLLAAFVFIVGMTLAVVSLVGLFAEKEVEGFLASYQLRMNRFMAAWGLVAGIAWIFAARFMSQGLLVKTLIATAVAVVTLGISFSYNRDVAVREITPYGARAGDSVPTVAEPGLDKPPPREPTDSLPPEERTPVVAGGEVVGDPDAVGSVKAPETAPRTDADLLPGDNGVPRDLDNDGEPGEALDPDEWTDPDGR